MLESQFNQGVAQGAVTNDQVQIYPSKEKKGSRVLKIIILIALAVVVLGGLFYFYKVYANPFMGMSTEEIMKKSFLTTFMPKKDQASKELGSGINNFFSESEVGVFATTTPETITDSDKPYFFSSKFLLKSKFSLREGVEGKEKINLLDYDFSLEIKDAFFALKNEFNGKDVEYKIDFSVDEVFSDKKLFLKINDFKLSPDIIDIVDNLVGKENLETIKKVFVDKWIKLPLDQVQESAMENALDDGKRQEGLDKIFNPLLFEVTKTELGFGTMKIGIKYNLKDLMVVLGKISEDQNSFSGAGTEETNKITRESLDEIILDDPEPTVEFEMSINRHFAITGADCFVSFTSSADKAQTTSHVYVHTVRSGVNEDGMSVYVPQSAVGIEELMGQLFNQVYSEGLDSSSAPGAPSIPAI